MITFIDFMWLIHYALLAFYGWEIGFFAYNRIMQPAAFKQVHGDAAHRLFDQYGSVIIGLVGWHCIVYGFYSRAVPILLLIYAGIGMYCGLKNEAVKPFLQKGGRVPDWVLNSKFVPYACAAAVALPIIVALQEETAPLIAALPALGTFWLVKHLQERRRIAAGKADFHEQPSSRGADEDEGDFTFNRDRFGNASSPGGNSSAFNAEADYHNALHEAQKWADQASSRENAERWAAKFEKLAGNPSLHAKDKLRYRLAAMLLRERLKGQGSAPPGGGSNADPTDADVARLGLPVPRR